MARWRVFGFTCWEPEGSLRESVGVQPGPKRPVSTPRSSFRHRQVADALADQVAEAVGKARPDVIVHQLTALAGEGMRGLKRRVAMTNRLRSEGTDHLLSAGQAVGVGRFVAQRIGMGLYVRTGGAVKTEEDPLDPTPPGKMREGAAGIRHLETAVLGADWTEGIVLRYGAFYGPGTGMGPGGEMYEMIRKRRFPLVGGGGVWSFIHIADATEATVVAVEHGSRGVYNVVDDEPAPGRRVAVGPDADA